MNRTKKLLALFACASMLTLASTGTAGAGEGICAGDYGTAPNGKIGSGPGTFVGGTFPGASLHQVVEDGGSATWLFKWKNTTSATRAIRIKPGRHIAPINSTAQPDFFIGNENVDSKFLPDTAKGVKFVVAPGKWSPKIRLTVQYGADPQEGWGLFAFYKGSPVVQCQALFAGVNQP
jgi:hypothetical protein